jgi:hypothetical protein
MPVAQALGILRDGAGSQFDADLVRTFLGLAPRLYEEEPRSGSRLRGS